MRNSKSLIALLVFFGAGSLTAETPVSSNNVAGTFPVEFVNNTGGKWANKQIYVFILGMNEQNHWCYLKPNGKLTPMNPGDENAPGHLTKDGRNYANYSFTLAEAPTFTIPTYLTGGRMYISLGSPLWIPIYENGWGGPDLLNPSNPNTDVIYDWYEFTYVQGRVNFGGNLTQVDQFGIPLTARLIQGTNYDQTVGTAMSREKLYAEFAAKTGPAFHDLATPARIYAPYKKDFWHGRPQSNYMSNYIEQAWTHYSTNAFAYQRFGDKFTGSVNKDGKFEFFKNDKGPFHIPKPTTTDVMAGSGALASGSQVELELEAEFCAAFNRGVFLNTKDWQNPAAYYTNSVHNDYAGFWHQVSLDKRAYGFSYDDVFDQSSVKILPNANPPTRLIITVGW